MVDPRLVLQKVIKSQNRRFTLNEAAAISGLSIDQVKDALEVLIARYLCRLQVTENGDLIYDFGEILRRRDLKSVAEIWKALWQRIWQIFKFIFRIWITIMLLFYFALFLILMIALLLLKQSQKGKRKSQQVNFSRIMILFSAIFRKSTHTGTIGRHRDRRGYSYKKYEPLPGTLKNDKKNFIASVYDFVFGPERVKTDPLSIEKETAAFLYKQNGVIVTSEIEMLNGMNFREAEHFFTEILIRFQGQVLVNENGVIYALFENLLRGLKSETAKEIIYYWDEYEPPYELNGNTGLSNLLITGMNGFILWISYIIVSGKMPGALSSLDETGFVSAMFHLVISNPVLFGWVPMIFSILFFLVPLLRWLKNIFASRKQHENNIRKRLFKVIFRGNSKGYDLDSVIARVNSHGTEEKLSADIVEDIFKQLILDLKGEISISEDAKILYNFPTIYRELSEVKKIRSNLKNDKNLGPIIMDSG